MRIAPYLQKEENPMTRQEILDQISQTFGGVPGWLGGLPDSQLEHQWGAYSMASQRQQTDCT
jgi:hypothetical protein